MPFLWSKVYNFCHTSHSKYTGLKWDTLDYFMNSKDEQKLEALHSFIKNSKRNQLNTRVIGPSQKFSLDMKN